MARPLQWSAGMPDASTWTPLFPLNTVLFPDGLLPLKVFEARYFDMVRDCMQQNAPFGVVLIESGQEVGKAATPYEIGCLAHIIQWDMPSPGIMLLRARGGKQFRILETRTRQDQRLEARIEMTETDDAIPEGDMLGYCTQALKSVIQNIEDSDILAQDAPPDSPFLRPIQLDNALWVTNRWCEILPLSAKAKQKLLELNDVQTRLSIVHRFLQQHEII